MQAVSAYLSQVAEQYKAGLPNLRVGAAAFVWPRVANESINLQVPSGVRVMPQTLN